MRFSCTTLRPGMAALNSIAMYGVEAPTPATRLFRNRISRHPRGGFYPTAHRYHL